MKPIEIGKHLVSDPRVCHGQLTFKGTRLPVETVLNWLAKGKSMAAILNDWPYLKVEAVAEAIQLAGEALAMQHQAETGTRNESVHPRRTAGRIRNRRQAVKVQASAIAGPPSRRTGS